MENSFQDSDQISFENYELPLNNRQERIPASITSSVLFQHTSISQQQTFPQEGIIHF